MHENVWQTLCLKAEGFKFIVTDTLTGTIEEFPSIRKGVKAMGWDQGYITALRQRAKQGPYKIIQETVSNACSEFFFFFKKKNW